MTPSPVFLEWTFTSSWKDPEAESASEEDAKAEWEPNIKSARTKPWNGSRESTTVPSTTDRQLFKFHQSWNHINQYKFLFKKTSIVCKLIWLYLQELSYFVKLISIIKSIDETRFKNDTQTRQTRRRCHKLLQTISERWHQLENHCRFQYQVLSLWQIWNQGCG
mgnify:CR=1 FL=1